LREGSIVREEEKEEDGRRGVKRTDEDWKEWGGGRKGISIQK